jgi:hypothetical protein
MGFQGEVVVNNFVKKKDFIFEGKKIFGKISECPEGIYVAHNLANYFSRLKKEELDRNEKIVGWNEWIDSEVFI